MNAVSHEHPRDHRAPKPGVWSERDRDQITESVRGALRKTLDHMLSSAEYDRTDRLWIADSQVLLTNPLSLAHGACGPLLLLHVAHPQGIPDEVVDWVLDRELSPDEYPPGLYSGLAGIAYAMREVGLDDAADAALEHLYRSPMLFDEPHLALGAAGWGLISLYQYRRTGNQVHLDWALRAGESIREAVRLDADSACWPVIQEGRVHYGFGYGASGIALFLLHLARTTRDDRFLRLATQGLDFDLEHKVEGELGWSWLRYEGDHIVRPYLIHGSAGIGSVAIRFAALLGKEQYLSAARQIAHDLSIKFTVSPGLFEGLAGIAEFMVDMFVFTGDEIYRSMALDMAETILWFQVPAAGGISWPNRTIGGVSSDYATGAAGIGLFFARLLSPGPRLVLDI